VNDHIGTWEIVQWYGVVSSPDTLGVRQKILTGTNAGDKRQPRLRDSISRM
jgi:hypothetical protein